MNHHRAKKILSAKLAGFALGLASLAAPAQTAASFGNLPLYFEAGAPAHFQAQGRDAQFSISSGGAQFVLRGSAGAPARAMRMEFTGANPQAQIRGDEKLSGKINYLTGNDSAKWRSNVPIFGKVRVDEIYPGVSLVYYGSQRQIEYDLTLAAGANPDLIALRFDGADKISISAQGELVLQLGGRKIFQPKPLIYQMTGGARKEIAGGYKILDAHRVAFAVGKHDCALPLVIDPVLSYATYFGGTSGENALAVAVNPSDGSIYVVGTTFSKQLSTAGAFQTNFAGGGLTGDAFVARFDNLGTNLMYLTYLGGSADDGAAGIAVDGAGNAFVTGYTDSPDFPTTNALFPKISGQFNGTFGSYPVDAFVAELNAGGSNLIYSTYLGGSSVDVGIGIAVDSSDNAYVAGCSYSTNFPTKNAIQNHLACPYSAYYNCNAFVSEIASNGAALVFSTYLGGTNFDEAQGIALDSGDDIYVTGFTSSTNFPTTNFIPASGTNYFNGQFLNGYTNNYGYLAYDAFVTKFAPSGSNLVYSTFLGGVNNDIANHIAVDGSGAAYVTGWTTSTNFPNTVSTNLIANFLTNNLNGLITTNSFLTKITNAIGTSAGIAYSVTFGGSQSDTGSGVAVDAAGDAFVTGASTSINFPCVPTNSAGMLNATNSGGSDVFVTAFNPDASAVLYSVLLGDAQNDSGYGIAVDATGNAYVVGQTYSANFATPGAFRNFLNATDDAFLAKILLLQTQPTLTIAADGGTNVSLTWPAFEPEFVLESNTNLISTNWLAVPQTPVLTNNSTLVILPAANDVQFFRLHKF